GALRGGGGRLLGGERARNCQGGGQETRLHCLFSFAGLLPPAHNSILRFGGEKQYRFGRLCTPPKWDVLGLRVLRARLRARTSNTDALGEEVGPLLDRQGEPPADQVADRELIFFNQRLQDRQHHQVLRASGRLLTLDDISEGGHR